jgi:mono/diheme cytochrome c family protein
MKSPICGTWLCGILLPLLFELNLAGAKPSEASPSAHPGATTSTTSTPAESAPGIPTYLQDVRPIFMGKCVRCHNSDNRIMYNWLDYPTALSDRKEIKKRVWDSWRGSYYKQPMPAGNGAEVHAMTEEERATIKRWVEAGAPYGQLSADSGPKSKEERIEQGKRLFATICAACHQPTGQGIPGQFPPLAGSDFLNADKERAIGVLLHGLQGQVVVNRRTFNNTMPPLPLGDADIASALTFVYNSFGNSGKEVTSEEVRRVRTSQGTVAASETKPSTSDPHQPSPWE